jgi:NAD(P)H-flavin reductase
MDQPIRAAAPDPMRPAAFRIDKVWRETSDTFTLELTPADGSGAFPFFPGQFNMLYAFGAGEAPISISGDPASPRTLVHTIRDVGAVTGALRRLKRGEAVGVRGPFGAGWPLEEAAGNDLFIVAGGIGLAPLRPIIYHAIAQRPRFGKVVLLYGARTPGDLLYRSELEKWRSRFDMDVQVTVDNAAAGWRGDVGVVSTLIRKARFDPPNAAAMLCGPEAMMRFAVEELLGRGLAPERISLSMERNIKCGVGLCGHCQFGPYFICKDGPVVRFDRVRELFFLREI